MVHFLKKSLPIFLSLLLLLNTSSSVIASEAVQPSVVISSAQIPAVDNFVNTTDSYNGDSSSVIVFIQDLHNDYAIQNNIYKTLKTLTKNNNFDIYGEGVCDDKLDVSILKDIPTSRIKNYTINNLFNNSQLSAYEYFALTNDKEIKGLEDKNVYVENLTLYNNITKNREFNNSIMDEVLSQLNYVKQHFIENRILAIQNFELTEIQFDDKVFPNLYKYKTISKQASQINKNKLDKQFKNFVSEYKTSSEVYSFIKLNSHYGYAKLYDYINNNLQDVAESNKELMSFLENNKLMTEINSVKLLYEQQALIDSLLSKENLEQTDKEIMSLEKFCLYLKDLSNMNVLPENYTELKENKRAIQELIIKYLPKNEAAFALTVLNNKEFFTFYDNNFKRNKIFADKLIKDSSSKIVVAGGFHKGLTDELKKYNKSYIVLTPRISLVKSAFNKLFTNTFEEDFNEDTANKLLTIIASWKSLFDDVDSFQQEISAWVNGNKLLSENGVEITVYEDKVSIKHNDVVYDKPFVDTATVKTELKASASQQKKTIENILNIAQRIELFGKNARVEVISDDSMLEKFIPAKVEYDQGQPIIYINNNFLEILSKRSYLTEFFVKLLYVSSSPFSSANNLLQLINDNYNNFKELYNLKKGIKSSLISRIKQNIRATLSTLIEKIKSFSRKEFSYELTSAEIKSSDEYCMNMALKQVSLARQTRSFLTTFIQPPIGAYISLDMEVADTDENVAHTVTIQGKMYNDTHSVLHAETLTFIDFLKNYIDEFEKLPSGNLTEKGIFLKDLLTLAEINGQAVSNKIFIVNPAVLENLGIHIDYQDTRNVSTVFDETNAVLNFVNEQLGFPLSQVTLYCTLAPCNKCVKTMSVLNIKRLVFGSSSANKTHKGSQILHDKGIDVKGGILRDECDGAIVNYRFMNASMFRTKIASAIQSVRRFFMYITNTFDKKTVRKALDTVSKYTSENVTNLFEIKYILKALQDKINWNNLQENESALEELVEFLKQIDAYGNPAKRAGIIYALKNKCTFKTKNGKIYFYNSDGKEMAFYINSVGKFDASQNYLDKMQQLALVRNFADLDDNLALRGQPFNENIARVFSTLTLYGIGTPIPITGNILDLVKKRLNPLGKQIMNFIPSVFIENAAIRCDITDGKFIYDDNYMVNVAESDVKESVLEYLRNMFSDISEDWYNLFVYFADKVQPLKNNDELNYTKLVDVVLTGYDIPDYMRELVEKWGNFNRGQASSALNEIYNMSITKDLSTEEFLYNMKIASLLELSRLYFSKDVDDKKEAVRLKQDFEKLYNGESLRGNFESPVRFVISPFRPNLVREICVKYFRPIVQAKYPSLKVESSGQTTFGIYKTGVNKSVPIKAEIEKGIPAENVIFSGDENSETGVDYPVYMMQTLIPEYKDMVVINTNFKTFTGDFISLVKNKKFSQEESFSGNIERSLLLQQTILDVVEENVGKIATDSEYIPEKCIAQQVKDRIDISEEKSSELVESLQDEYQLDQENISTMQLLSAA